jgi:hypothetical protein
MVGMIDIIVGGILTRTVFRIKAHLPPVVMVGDNGKCQHQQHCCRNERYGKNTLHFVMIFRKSATNIIMFIVPA